MKKLTFLLVLLSGTVLVSCTKEPVEVLSSNATADYEAEALTKAVSPKSFNWETADWMPTPPGQSKIPVPWVGQGSLSGFYKMDVVQDYKKSRRLETCIFDLLVKEYHAIEQSLFCTL